MHILIIAPEQLPLPGSGSVEICIVSIAKQLANHHKVTIVSRQFSRNRIQRADTGRIRMIRVHAPSKSAYIAAVLRHIRGNRYDVIQVDNRPHYIHAVKQAFPWTPVSLFLHSLTFVPKTASVTNALAKADCIVANSVSLKNNLSRRFPGQRHKIRTVYLGVDSTRFRIPSEDERQRIRAKYKLGNSFVILFAGRIIPRKGLPILIKAASIVRRRLKHTRLIVAGRGNSSYIRSLKGQASMLKVPAMFLGEVPHSMIHQVYQAADCFVCPSQRHESFGLVNVEAMASGVPIVASHIGGIKEIINHGINGYSVKTYRSTESFAQYISKIAEQRAKAKQMAQMGRQTVLQRFSWLQTAKQLEDIYIAKARDSSI